MVVGALDNGIHRDGDAAAGAQHAAKLRKAPHRVGEKHKPEIAQHDVETGIRERKCLPALDRDRGNSARCRDARAPSRPWPARHRRRRYGRWDRPRQAPPLPTVRCRSRCNLQHGDFSCSIATVSIIAKGTCSCSPASLFRMPVHLAGAGAGAAYQGPTCSCRYRMMGKTRSWSSRCFYISIRRPGSGASSNHGPSRKSRTSSFRCRAGSKWRVGRTGVL